jgi:hypothetical protein
LCVGRTIRIPSPKIKTTAIIMIQVIISMYLTELLDIKNFSFLTKGRFYKHSLVFAYMRKELFLFFGLIVLFSLGIVSGEDPLTSTPDCVVTGLVKDVRYVLDNTPGNLGNRYHLTILVFNLTANNSDGFVPEVTCEDVFPIGSDQEVRVLESLVPNNATFDNKLVEILLLDSAMSKNAESIYILGNFSSTCSEDAKICEDGTVLERDPVLGCEFPKCPEELVLDCADEGGMCGGIAGISCCDGLTCQLEGDYPDASGTCVQVPSFECVDSCGDGVCSEVVCQGEGCPCAETVDSCSADCAEPEEEGNSLFWLFVVIFVAVALIIVGIKIAKWLVWAAIIAAVIFVIVYLFVL